MDMTLNSNVIHHGENKENYDPSSSTSSRNVSDGLLRQAQKIRQTRSQVHSRQPLLEIPVNYLRRNNEIGENVSGRIATTTPQALNNRNLTQVGSHVIRVRNEFIEQRSTGRISFNRHNNDVRHSFRQRDNQKDVNHGGTAESDSLIENEIIMESDSLYPQNMEIDIINFDDSQDMDVVSSLSQQNPYL
ncbi:hypothetical protein C2G38_2247947 [Gigaspora rosea]|uniref:Uncharacterized protein n=1 Tax=Gigaspora rosea TaxID=44941 RepID=A0A397UYV7_9GLOM|nr:hypothetical protein C2G38_2247947 [Gigaspora rosea]CAG8718236.1 7413_t:CDS:2 [Gigaspora rosea]